MDRDAGTVGIYPNRLQQHMTPSMRDHKLQVVTNELWFIQPYTPASIILQFNSHCIIYDIIQQTMYCSDEIAFI